MSVMCLPKGFARTPLKTTLVSKDLLVTVKITHPSEILDIMITRFVQASCFDQFLGTAAMITPDCHVDQGIITNKVITTKKVPDSDYNPVEMAIFIAANLIKNIKMASILFRHFFYFSNFQEQNFLEIAKQPHEKLNHDNTISLYVFSNFQE